MKRRYFLTPGAVKDIRDIGNWSFERWGKETTLKYLAELHQGLEFIATHFETFKSNKTLAHLSGGTGLMIYPIKEHYVVYVPIGKKVIAVATVIRQGRDIPSLLKNSDFSIRRELKEIRDNVENGLMDFPDS